MSGNFRIVSKKRNGNLHISPQGDFNGSSACELVNYLNAHHDGNDVVIIHTQDLHKMCPFGCQTFQCRLKMSRVRAHQLLFAGEKGAAIAPEGSKVIDLSKTYQCYCKQKCRKCLYAERETVLFHENFVDSSIFTK